MMNLGVGIDLLGLPGVPAGGIALLAQSGNIALDLFVEAADSPGEGFSIYVGMGNQADLDLAEILDYLGSDPATRVIMVHAEGLQRGRAFWEVARRVAMRKPVLFLKGGRTEAGEGSARSHTGAVATDLRLFRAALASAGVLEVTRVDAWLALARSLADLRNPLEGEGFAILSDGGGQATLAADALTEGGVPLATLSPGVQGKLRELLGMAAAVTNPVDVAGAGDRDPEIFATALRLLLDEPSVAGVVQVGLFGGYALRFSSTLEEAEQKAAQDMGVIARESGKPLIFQSIYAHARTEALSILSSHGIQAHRSLEVACAAAASLWTMGTSISRGASAPQSASVPQSASAPQSAKPPNDALAGAGAVVSPHPAVMRARSEGRSVLLEPEVRALLEEAGGVALVEAHLARTRDEAMDLAAGPLRADPDTGNPQSLVLRVVSRGFPHKTEVGGVVLGVRGAEEAARAFDGIMASLTAAGEARGVDPGVEGVLVSPRLATPTVELLVGVRRDPSFGPVLTVGAGGTLVEVLDDVALRLLPVTEDDVREMLGALRVAPLLRGYRGQPGVDEAALVQLILGVAATALRHPEVTDLELNPVFAYPDKVVAVDARGFLMAR
jgi:acetyltransferase